MKCYTHHAVDAVGLCKSCSRGVCPDCAAEVGRSIACRGECEEKVRALDALIERNQKLTVHFKTVKRNGVAQSFFYIAPGLVFAYFGFVYDQPLSAAISLPFVGYGLYCAYRTYTFPNLDDDSGPDSKR